MQEPQFTPSQCLARCLNQIEAQEASVQAWAFVAVAAARQHAALLEAQIRDRPRAEHLAAQPLLGVPVGLKDIFATTTMPTAWGLSWYADRYLAAEAAVVTRLQAAGAILVGKTVTTELATAAAGPTRNPHNLAHTPGGSSSGSAAAVAAGMVPVALGSQTMGSILRPAAYCGIFGLKPSFGAISRQGVMPVSTDLDHVGLFARSLEEVDRVFAVLADPSGEPLLGAAERSQPPSPPRLAWLPTPYWSQVEPVAQTRLRQAVEVLSQAGMAITPIELPAPCADYWETVQTLCAYGLYQHHGDLLHHHADRCSPQLQDWLRRGQTISEPMYTAAQLKSQQYRQAIAALFEHYDAILSPVTTGPAPKGLTNTGSPLFCGLWTACGVPAINLPIGTTAAGLPLGCQLIGPFQGDRQLLQIAHACWQQLRPVFGDIAVPAP